MSEIAEIPLGSHRFVSTFSGAGGSCLGFRMAGFRCLWASEFIEAARETYALNFPETPVDPRDIRVVTPEEILSATGLSRGELDVFEGSPPCASFSMAGGRESGWGESKTYSDTEQRVDDLFHEYVRLLRGLEPKVFVAENVPGMSVGTATGFFMEVLDLLRSAGYVAGVRKLDSQWLGVPQARQRLIFVGVRRDLGLDPVWPEPLPYRYTLADALPWVKGFKATSGYAKGHESAGDEPAPTVTTNPSSNRYSSHDVEAEVDVRITSRGPFGVVREWDPDKPAPAMLASETGHRVYVDETLDGTAIGGEWDRLLPGQSSEKYFQLVRPDVDQPCPTVTQTGGVRGAASVTHPTERRKFTIPELRRICGFPDDFQLTGNFRRQWERLGRAVPPPMMRAVAETIRDKILSKI